MQFDLVDEVDHSEVGRAGLASPSRRVSAHRVFELGNQLLRDGFSP